MELTKEQKVLLEKTLLHLNSFTITLAHEFREDKEPVVAKMLAHNMELCDELEPLIKPFMGEKALSTVELSKFGVSLVLLAIEEDLTKLLGEQDEEI